MQRQRQSACIYCGDPIKRGNKESQRDYLRRRFCGVECAAAQTGQTARAGSFDDTSNAIASDALNAGMWAVYARVAKERALAHPLVAAVQLGVRA